MGVLILSMHSEEAFITQALQAGAAVTQGVAALIKTNGLELLGAGPYTLTEATNDVDKLAANITGNLSFQLSPNWSVNWNTSYSLTDREFGSHRLNFQRDLHEHEEEESRRAIEAQGCEIVELDISQHKAFAAAVRPIYQEARQSLGEELFKLTGTA